MNPPNSPPRWVRQLHQDEAVWTAYQRRVVLRAAPSSLPERMRILAGLEEFWEERDWLTAEREVDGLVEAHGHFSDERR